MPSLNQGHFIDQTLDSILSQDFPAAEVIVVDGGSTDCTCDVLRRYGDRIQWASEPDTGQSNAINKGFTRASGDVISFLNSDDLLEPGALRAVAEFFSARPTAQWVYGRCHVIDENGKAVRSFVDAYKSLWGRFANSRAALMILNYIPQPATFWRRPAMERVGRLDESLHYAMDYDYWLRLSAIDLMHFVDRYLASFRVHQGSKSIKHTKAQLAEACRLAERHGAGWFRALHAAHDAATLLTYRIWYGSRH